MADQLSARDWLDQGLKALATNGFTSLKAEPLAKAMGVSRGSFYWHFADIAAFHAAVLKHLEIGVPEVIPDRTDGPYLGEEARGEAEVDGGPAQHPVSLAERRADRVERDAAHDGQ